MIDLSGYSDFVLAYSGGKDSTALLSWFLENIGRDRLRIVFCDTGAEWPESLEYIEYIQERLEIDVETIRSGDRIPEPFPRTKHPYFYTSRNLFDMVRGRGKWPGARYRYCTSYLKRWPLTMYAKELENPLLVLGQRAEESPARAQLEEFERNAYHTGQPHWRPILNWTGSDVFEQLATRGIELNPIYRWVSRCGCWCCPMARIAEVKNFCRVHPELAEVAVDLEREIGHRWTWQYSLGQIYEMVTRQMSLGFSLEEGRS